ncbi:unnamed protein product [Soboliphyme baturini]|uniref:ATP-dependent DNA helicase n=1 Tax=Soboliphyme baturini TaxID=241478 RepID=A0A183IFH6_9BILA|nr:unnamed protein product [Soboliphyme baturini]
MDIVLHLCRWKYFDFNRLRGGVFVKYDVSFSVPLSHQLYNNTIGLLITVVGTRTEQKLEDSEKMKLRNCAQNSTSVEEHARCFAPYFQMELEEEERKSGSSNRFHYRFRRDIYRDSHTLVGQFLHWAKKLLVKIKSRGKKLKIYANLPSPFQHSRSDNEFETDSTIQKPTAKIQKMIDTYRNCSLQAMTNYSSNVDLRQFAAPDWMKNMMIDIRVLMEHIDSVGDLADMFRVLSPRLFPVEPEKNAERILSPNILSLYDDNDEFLSFTNLLSPMTELDRVAMIELVKELLDVNDLVNDTLHLTRGETTMSIEEKLLVENVERLGRLTLAFERLTASYSEEQADALWNNGYTFLTADQLHIIYSGNETKLGLDLQNYNHTTDHQREIALKKYFIAIADGKVRLNGDNSENVDEFRQEEEVVEGTVSIHPNILSPLIGSPTVLGNVALSPFIFSPVIFSPSTTTIFTTSPMIGAPVLMSPVLVHPDFLSPKVMSPFILTPVVVTPIIFGPLVINPSVMVPFAVAALIFNAGFLSPFVLNPNVLTPSILSPQAYWASVLSPGVLSPVIDSPCKVCTVIGSPCILC